MAERADVAGRLVNEAMADHFVLSLEAFPAFAPWAVADRTEERPVLGVDVCV